MMPRLGQGTWRMGDRAPDRNAEIAALRAGIAHGMTLIDTAEMYGDGRAEALVGEAIRGLLRDDLFIVSKVYPHNAGGARLAASCDATLSRLGIDTLDLYLLHWPGSIPLSETVSGMEALRRAGKIRHWGVSNFDTGDMEALWATPGGTKCHANQVLYHLGSRGVEYSLLPWLSARNVQMMAYCPLAQAGRLRKGLADSACVRDIARRHQLTPMQVLLCFVLSRPGVVAIPKAADISHAQENAAVAGVTLPASDLALLDAAFPAPRSKVPLDIE